MRPKIPDPLAERTRVVYEDAGYATESEFIREAIRRHLEQTEDAQTEESDEQIYDFEYHFYSVADGAKYPSLYLRPEGSQVEDPDTDEIRRVLNTGVKKIDEETISDQLEQLDVVYKGELSLLASHFEEDDDGWIQIHFDKEVVDEVGVEAAVPKILEAAANAIESSGTWESPQERLESVMEQYTTE